MCRASAWYFALQEKDICDNASAAVPRREKHQPMKVIWIAWQKIPWFTVKWKSLSIGNRHMPRDVTSYAFDCRSNRPVVAYSIICSAFPLYCVPWSNVIPSSVIFWRNLSLMVISLCIFPPQMRDLHKHWQQQLWQVVTIVAKLAGGRKIDQRTAINWQMAVTKWWNSDSKHAAATVPQQIAIKYCQSCGPATA